MAIIFHSTEATEPVCIEKIEKNLSHVAWAVMVPKLGPNRISRFWLSLRAESGTSRHEIALLNPE